MAQADGHDAPRSVDELVLVVAAVIDDVAVMAEHAIGWFVETARSPGCDEDEAAFHDKLPIFERQKPKDVPKTSNALKRSVWGRCCPVRLAISFDIGLSRAAT